MYGDIWKERGCMVSPEIERERSFCSMDKKSRLTYELLKLNTAINCVMFSHLIWGKSSHFLPRSRWLFVLPFQVLSSDGEKGNSSEIEEVAIEDDEEEEDNAGEDGHNSGMHVDDR